MSDGEGSPPALFFISINLGGGAIMFKLVELLKRILEKNAEVLVSTSERLVVKSRMAQVEETESVNLTKLQSSIDKNKKVQRELDKLFD